MNISYIIGHRTEKPCPARLACIVLFCLASSLCFGQGAKNIKFNRFSSDLGLSQKYFTSILQDSRGFMWFGTDNGLIRFDGYSCTTYSSDPRNRHSLSSNNVVALAEDSNRNIWIAGDLGICKLNPRTGLFTAYHHDSHHKFSLPSEQVSCLVTDRSGRLWIGTANAGVCFYDEASDRFIPVNPDHPDSLCSLNIFCLMVDHQNSLWMGTAGGMNIYNIADKKFSLFNPADHHKTPIKSEVRCMIEDHAGEIWYSLYNKGIYHYVPATGVLRTFQHSNKNSGTLSSNMVNTLAEDRHGNIWAGGFEGGISIYQAEKDDFQTYRANAKEPDALGSDQIMTFFKDKSDVIWIGTDADGLYTSYPDYKNFLVYQNWDKEYLSHEPLSLYKDHSGHIYMTALESGIQEFIPATGSFKSFKVILPNDQLSAINSTFGVIEASDGNFWGVSYDEGLYQLDRKTGKFTTKHLETNNRNTTFHNIYSCITEDEQKHFWIGSKNGLKCYDLTKKKMYGFEELYHDTNFLSHDNIINLYVDPENILWIAGTFGGLTLLNTKTGTVKTLKHLDSDSSTISSDAVNCFYEDNSKRGQKSGSVWIGTSRGLNEFNRVSGKFKTYTINNGLPDNSIRGITSDDEGNLWIITSNGICRFTPPSSGSQSPACRIYKTSDGLPGDEFYFDVLLKGDDGTIFLANPSGLVTFKPQDLKDNSFIPPVFITEFSLFNKPVRPEDSSGILNWPSEYTNAIKLNYRQNVISFTFSALNYIHPEKNRYAYKLEGFDRDWIYTNASRRFANYTNLDAGKYIFKVKGSNNDGMWNEVPATIQLIVTPPFWATWWFRILAILVAASVVYIVYRYRVGQIIHLQTLRNNIASDLHDEIGSTLNSISILSSVANQQAGKSLPALEQIGENSRSVIESMNDIVWTINPENDNFEKILTRMRSFAHQVMKGKGIEYRFDVDESSEEFSLPMKTRKNFYLIFKEATINLAKYSKSTEARFEIRFDKHELKMTIYDNGIGFDADLPSPGNGVKNMRKRAIEIPGELKIRSIAGTGTHIELTMKI